MTAPEPPAEPVEQPTRPASRLKFVRSGPDGTYYTMDTPDGPMDVSFIGTRCSCDAHARIEDTGQRLGRRDGVWGPCDG